MTTPAPWLQTPKGRLAAARSIEQRLARKREHHAAQVTKLLRQARFKRRPMLGKTIDEVCGSPKGTFAAFAKKKDAFLVKIEKDRKRRIAAFLNRKPRKPLRKRSKATAARDVELRAIVASLMMDPFNASCIVRKEGVCTGVTSCFHHVKPRSVRPDLVLEPSNMIPVCDHCHYYIKNHPAEAYAKGWLKHANDP